MASITTRDLEQFTNRLARYMPNDCTFASKGVNDTTFRNLLKGLAGEQFRANGLLKEYCEQILPDETVKFISEWESTVGIPDNCFDGTGTLEERRRDVLVKLASSGIQTKQDFIDLAALFGITVTIQTGIENITFPLTLPFVIFDTNKDARFTIIVFFSGVESETFPLTLPFTLGTKETGILECLFTNLKPANCQVIFKSI